MIFLKDGLQIPFMFLQLQIIGINLNICIQNQRAMKFILVFITTILSLAACTFRSGSGNIVTEQRQTAAFTGVKASGDFEVEIVPADNLKLTVEADDNVIGDIITKTEDNMLQIKLRSGLNWNNFHAKIYISAPGIRLIAVSYTHLDVYKRQPFCSFLS